MPWHSTRPDYNVNLGDNQLIFIFFNFFFILGEFSVHIWDTGFQNLPVKKRLQINNFTHYYFNKMTLVGVNVYLFSGRQNGMLME